MSGQISYKQFGQYLLETMDLDPLYAILKQSNMGKQQMKRWLLAYWVYYAAGPSSFLSEITYPDSYYNAMLDGDALRWPRGHERRHMRGKTLMKTVACLRGNGVPEAVVDNMTRHTTFAEHTGDMSKFYGFGPWISFKIFDMMERVLGIPTDLTNVNLYIYRDPVKGAALYEFGDQHHDISQDELGGVVGALLKMFQGYLAPPLMDRPLSPMEIETILCKAKSNYNGHYPLGNDVFDIWHGLHAQDWGNTAKELTRLLEPLYHCWDGWTDDARNVRVVV